MDSGLRGCGGVTYLHLGDQRPYSRWFSEQARGLARELGAEFAEADITGRPDFTAPLGAYLSTQVHVPGYPLLGAPRSTATLLSLLEEGLPEHDALQGGGGTDVPSTESSTPSHGIFHTARPGDRDWLEAVSGSVRVCLSESLDNQQRQAMAEAKVRWFRVLAGRYGCAPAITVVRSAGEVAGFAELIPAAAAHVSLPGAAPRDRFLTCVHAAPDAADLRSALLRAALGSACAAQALAPAIWAVSGRRLPYPNGPLPLFLAAGFEVVAGLGRRCHAPDGWDDLLPVRSAGHAVKAGHRLPGSRG
ncbi:MAG TPA: hypothetical protein DEQ28_00360 [Clostridiales bacterium]|nr:hypothetical protein [Clostridiales bacterium]